MNEPIVKKPPVADDNYCYVCILRKKSNLFNTILLLFFMDFFMDLLI